MSRYLAEITYYDDEVGQTLDLLKKHQLSDNTLVIVVSEQGNSLPFAKWTCYDRGLQSAFIARWPGKIEPGATNPAMIEYADILPTFIDAAGGTPPAVIDGKSLLPVFAGKQQHRDHVFGIMTTRKKRCHKKRCQVINLVRSGFQATLALATLTASAMCVQAAVFYTISGITQTADSTR